MVTMPRSHYVCFPCRYGFKRDEAADAAKCPQCGGAATLMGTSFRVPPRHATNQWKKIEALASAGMYFRPYQDTTSLAADEYPIATHAQAKNAVRLIRAKNDARLTGRGLQQSPPARLQPRPHHERRQLAAAERALQQARGRRAGAMQRGDHERALRFERHIASLEQTLKVLAQRQRMRERGYIV